MAVCMQVFIKKLLKLNMCLECTTSLLKPALQSHRALYTPST